MPASAARTGRGPASTRCRCRRDRACALKAQSRCRRIHRHDGLSCRVQSLSPSQHPRSCGGRKDPARGGANEGARARRKCLLAHGSQVALSIAMAAPALMPLDMLDRMGDSGRIRYDAHAIEARRQAAWLERDAFKTPELADELPHLYIKPSAPFTSGNIHIGHARTYSTGEPEA